MTSIGRLKRSCLCAAVGMIASAVGELTLGLIANQPNESNVAGGDLLVTLVGVFLAPGWLVFRRTFERTRPNEFLGLFVFISLFSFIADTALIFVLWEVFCRGRKRMRLSS